MKKYTLSLLTLLSILLLASCGVPKEEVEKMKKENEAKLQQLKKQQQKQQNKIKAKDAVIDSLSTLTQQIEAQQKELESKYAQAEEEKKQIIKELTDDTTGKYYKIQIAAVRKNKRNTKFFGEYKFTEANGNFYKFMYGHFKDVKEAYRVLRVIKNANTGADGKQYSGVTVNAFVVPYIDGTRLMDMKTRG